MKEREKIIGDQTVRTYRQGPIYIQHIGTGRPDGTISGGTIELRRFYLGFFSITRTREVLEDESIRASWETYKAMWREEFLGNPPIVSSL